jgi:hypothetical protein
MTILVDSFLATGCVIVGSELDSGVCAHEDRRGETFAISIDFEAILTPNGTPMQQCVRQDFA